MRARGWGSGGWRPARGGIVVKGASDESGSERGEILQDAVFGLVGEDAGAALGEQALGAERLVLLQPGRFFQQLFVRA